MSSRSLSPRRVAVPVVVARAEAAARVVPAVGLEVVVTVVVGREPAAAATAKGAMAAARVKEVVVRERVAVV